MWKVRACKGNTLAVRAHGVMSVAWGRSRAGVSGQV